MNVREEYEKYVAYWQGRGRDVEPYAQFVNVLLGNAQYELSSIHEKYAKELADKEAEIADLQAELKALKRESLIDYDAPITDDDVEHVRGLAKKYGDDAG